jgi:alpha-N-acetylglucosaminidase
MNAFKESSRTFIELIEDMDRLLATRKDFLFGRWIADARKWGLDEKEKALYEMNAKDLITLWGDTESPLNEYACRQWSGLLNDFYKPRWQQFFSRLEESLQKGTEMDFVLFNKEIKEWEWKWVNARKDYSIVPTDDPVVVAKLLYAKYRKKIGNEL